MGDELEDEHHGDFDPNELRQHEEFTKVKNVDKIELGRYQLETWYFSPLPPEYNNCKVGPSTCMDRLQQSHPCANCCQSLHPFMTCGLSDWWLSMK